MNNPNQFNNKLFILILLFMFLAFLLNGSFLKMFSSIKDFSYITRKTGRGKSNPVYKAMEVGVATHQKNVSNCAPMRLEFINKSHPNFKTRVALFSFPGSGNTWLRHLIQEATGFYTGSVYNDQTLYQKGFKGELHGIKDGSCIVYKTHARETQWNKTAMLLRNPFHAIKAFFNFEKGHSNKHISYASNNSFSSSAWKRFVKKWALRWESSNLHYLNVFKGHVHLLLYEDLQDNLIGTMESLVKFLNLTPDPKNLLCMYYNQEGQHHRKPRNGTSISDIYDKEMVSLINSAIRTVSAAVANRFPNRHFDTIDAYSRVH